MSAEHPRCRRVADDWDRWLMSGLPSKLRRHARSCADCAAELAELSRLAEGLAAVQTTTAADANGLDVVTRIMTHVEHKSVGTGRASWWGSFGFGLAALAAVLVAVIGWQLSFSSSSALALDAPAGALVTIAGETRRVRGRSIALCAPASVTAATQEDVAVVMRGGRVVLWPDTTVGVSGETTAHLVRGGLTAQGHGIRIEADHMHVVGAGVFSIENHPMEQAMRTFKKHHVAAAAVVAVAVYAGWAQLSTATSSTRIQAPGGAYIDDKGQVRRFALADEGGEGAGAVAAAGKPGAGAPRETLADGERVTGAYWDEDKQLVVFTLPGEVFDGSTGDAITDFEITATSTKSSAYGQTAAIEQSFRDRPEGQFELKGLGLGTWRLKVRASGYSPLTQTVTLADLGTQQYLVLPLSLGAELSGQVVDWRGRPVPDATVGLSECVAGRSAPKGCSVVETKDDGTFVLPGLPEDTVFSIEARHPRYGLATQRNLRRQVGQTEHVVLSLSGIVKIYGEVTRGQERRPVAQAVVVSGEETRGGGGGTARRIESDANGFYELFVPLAAQPEAFVESEGGRPIGRAAAYPESRSAWQLSWVDAASHVAEVRIDFQLAMESARLYGRVTDDKGGPMVGVELDLRNTSGWKDNRGHETFPTSATTDGSGRYSVDNMPAKAGYRVSYRLRPEDAWKRLGYVNIAEQTAVEANFRVGAGGIRGRFSAEAGGEALSSSDRDCDRLGAQPKGSPATFILPHCYEDGRFEFENVPPGDYVLKNRLEWMELTVSFVATEVTVTPGRIADGVTVPADGPASDEWRFRILDQKNRFLMGAFIRYRQKKTMYTTSLHVQPDGTAKQSISRMFKQIQVDAAGYDSATVDLEGRDPTKVIDVRLSKTDD